NVLAYQDKVYFTGEEQHGTPESQVVIGALDLAGNVLFFKAYSFSTGPSVGLAIGVDPNSGNINVGGVLAGYPSTFHASPDGSSLNAVYFTSPGSLNAVNVDAGGNAYYAGSYAANGVQNELVAKLAPDGQTVLYGYYYTWTDGTTNYNSPAYDAKIDA